MRWSSLLATLALALLLSGCTIGRWYMGSPLLADPNQALLVGSTSKADVLGRFGPPDRILRQRTGDVFVYRQDQRNSSEFNLVEPFTRFVLFTWEKTQDKSDRLMVFFDPAGVVSAFGYRRGREELELF
jgi:hypothetical protein